MFYISKEKSMLFNRSMLLSIDQFLLLCPPQQPLWPSSDLEQLPRAHEHSTSPLALFQASRMRYNTAAPPIKIKMNFSMISSPYPSPIIFPPW
jgi:hypothetical protein